MSEMSALAADPDMKCSKGFHKMLRKVVILVAFAPPLVRSQCVRGSGTVSASPNQKTP